MISRRLLEGELNSITTICVKKSTVDDMNVKKAQISVIVTLLRNNIFREEKNK